MAGVTKKVEEDTDRDDERSKTTLTMRMTDILDKWRRRTKMTHF